MVKVLKPKIVAHKPALSAAPDYSAMADALGKIKAKIADLEEQEESLKDAIKLSGADEIDGNLFHVTVSRFDKKHVDYKGLLEVLDVPKRTLNKYTTYKPQVSVNVSSR